VNQRARKGAILIITLWILAILAILSIGIGGRMAIELKLTALHRDGVQALYSAKAGVKRSIDILLRQDHAVDSLNEAWSNNDEDVNPAFRSIKVGDAGSFTVSYVYAGDRVFYGFQDEKSRLNINGVPPEVISRLISYLDRGSDNADEIAQNITDWRDQNITDQDGAPEYDYVNEGYPRKDAKFDGLDELMLVRGMDKVLFLRIKDYVTVYPVSDSVKVNVNTAGPAVLYALGFEEPAVADIVSFRAGEDGIEGTGDDVVLNDVSFADFLSVLPEDRRLLACYGSDCYRIISTGCSANGKVSKTVTAVALGENILFWSEE
jgi:type II secretory pathway component PulK